MPAKKGAQQSVKSDKVERAHFCPLLHNNEQSICLRDECALYVSKARRCTFWLLSYYLWKGGAVEK